MTAAMQCGRCKEPVAPGAGEYTPDGELLCGKCRIVFQVSAADATVASSKRKVRILAGVVLAVIIFVPGVLFAVGAGQYVIKAMFGITMATWMLSWFVLNEMARQARRGTRDPGMRSWYWRIFFGFFFGALLLGALTMALSKATGLQPGF